MRELLYQALSRPLGIVIQTDDAERCIQKLQAARREAKDPVLSALTIMKSRDDPEGEVWVVHQGSESKSNAEEA